MNKYLLTSDRKPIIGKRPDTLKIYLDESMTFIGVTYKTIHKGLLLRLLMT